MLITYYYYVKYDIKYDYLVMNIITARPNT